MISELVPPEIFEARTDPTGSGQFLVWQTAEYPALILLGQTVFERGRRLRRGPTGCRREAVAAESVLGVMPVSNNIRRRSKWALLESLR